MKKWDGGARVERFADNAETINSDVTMDGAAGVLLAGRYRVVRQLGQGGMGSVWLAEDTKLDGRKVAVKMLPSILVSNKRAYQQVKQEALVSLKLTHPNIVAIRAFEEESGNPFLVMDYIEGQTLDDCLAERGKLTEDETIALLAPIAAALDYAHGQGVVHRDVKPGNVMIRKDGVPFVLDFGIAREIQETMTRVTGKLSSGTLMYMSPEQLHGAAPKPAQDVYSFAAMAYECLTGTPPFSRGQIEYRIEHDTPAALGPGFVKCSQGVMAGLEKSPEARPATCAAVLTAGAERMRNAHAGVFARKPWIAMVLLGVLATGVFVGGRWWWQERTKAEWQQREALAAERTKAARVAVEKAEAKRLANEKRLAEQAKIDAAKVDEDADRRRQEEAAKLATTRTKIAIKISAAKDDYAKVAPYRSEREGFETHLAEIDRQWAAVNGVQSPQTLSEAGKTLAMVTESADAIAFELNWLKTNREGRDAAMRLEKEIVDELEAKLCELRANDVAKSKYDKGQGERQSAAAALARGDFASAQRQYEAAKASLSVALVEARQFHVKTALAVANEYKAAAQWQQCIVEAEKVLGWDPKNAEGQALKAEAEKHLMPTARVVVKIGEREVVGAILHLGRLTSKLPGVWNTQSLKDGHFFPEDRDYEVTYEENGKTYVGFMRGGRRDVDWRGQKTFVVKLTEYKGPKPGATKTIPLPGGATMEMVWCPPGRFMMGSPETEDGRGGNETQHWVTLTQGFWIGKYEVTQQQWESVMGENPSSFKGADRPVEWVSWNDCQMFARKVNVDGKVTVSLPTEAQWEYACRAGTTTPFSFGQALNGDKANCDGSYPYGTTIRGRHRKETAAVGSYAPNAWGLYDMHGNVLEWCADRYGQYAGDSMNPTGATSGPCRIARGGGWDSYALCCRSSSRSRYVPGLRDFYLGFRLVCSSEE